MTAVAFHDVGDIRLDDLPEPSLQEPTDTGWIKVELQPQKRPTPGGKGGEEVIEGAGQPDRVMAEASPNHEARSAKPGRR
ncbi:hypothetical protein D3C80_202260 [compost metagenome]